MMSKNKRLVGILATVICLLCIPLIAMQFTAEVDWKLFDFLVMGTLLLLFGLSIELFLRKFKTAQKRFVAIAVTLILFMLIWAELAVGIFGTPFEGS